MTRSAMVTASLRRQGSNPAESGNSFWELLRKLGGKCNAGRQWGFGADYIWVNGGCRGEFGYGYANIAPEPKPDKDKGPSTGLIIGGIIVAGGLLALLASAGRLPLRGNRASGLVSQGHALGTPGEIEVEVEVHGSQVTAVQVGGSAAVEREGVWNG